MTSKQPRSKFGREEQPFWLELEEMLQSQVLEQQTGYMNGSMSGESWRAFLKTVRDEVLERLQAYRVNDGNIDFCASSLGPYREERRKLERTYMRDLVVLYHSAERAYKTLNGQ